MDTLTALQVLNALLAALGNAAVAAGKITAVITKANSEGRDVSVEELAEAAAESDAATAKLKERVDAFLAQQEK
jgi:hypothetical protein